MRVYGSNLVRSAIIGFSTMLPVTAGCDFFNKAEITNPVKNIEVVNGGADCIASTVMNLKIGGEIYTADYGSFGINYDSIKREDSLPVQDDIVQLIKCNEQQIIKIACDMSYGKSVDSTIIPVSLEDCK